MHRKQIQKKSASSPGKIALILPLLIIYFCYLLHFKLLHSRTMNHLISKRRLGILKKHNKELNNEVEGKRKLRKIYSKIN